MGLIDCHISLSLAAHKFPLPSFRSQVFVPLYSSMYGIIDASSAGRNRFEFIQLRLAIAAVINNQIEMPRRHCHCHHMECVFDEACRGFKKRKLFRSKEGTVVDRSKFFYSALFFHLFWTMDFVMA